MPSRYQMAPPAAYQSGSYNTGDNIAQLILAQGQNHAQAAMQSGDIWGNAFHNIGQTLAGGLQHHAEQKAISKRDAAWTDYIGSGEWQQDPTKAYATALKVWGPEKGPEQFKGLVSAQQLMGDKRDPVADQKALGTIIGSMEDLDDAGRARLYPQVAALTKRVYPEVQLDPAYNPDRWKEHSAIGRQLRGEKAPDVKEIKTRNADGSETVRLVAGTAGQEFTSAAEPPKPAGVGTFEDYVVQRFGPRPSADQITAARKDYQQADDRPININTGQPRPLTQTAEANLIQNLTKEWDTKAAPVRAIERQVSMMEAGLDAARVGNLGAGSQAIIQTFNKILDAESAVREPEYLRSIEGQAFLNRIKGNIERLRIGGNGIPVPELERYAELARDMAKRQSAYLPAIQARIGKKADRYNLPHELIFEGATPAPGGGAPPAGIPPTSGGPPVRVSSPEEAMRLPSGTPFITPDGKHKIRP